MAEDFEAKIREIIRTRMRDCQSYTEIDAATEQVLELAAQWAESGRRAGYAEAIKS